MAREKPANPGQYDEVVARLERIVEALEGGELSLEESLERFSEGIRLVKQGEGLLTDAERRIEQLLSEDGSTAPLRIEDEASGGKGAPPPRPGAEAGEPDRPAGGVPRGSRSSP